MTRTPRKKLPKLERRNQLLVTARDIIVEEGADALTLGRVAERAGVTKPIAYGHFGSRAGLLMMLYDELHRNHVAELLEAITLAPKRLHDMARVAAETFMACAADDPYTYAVMAALQGDAEGKTFYARLTAEYVELYVRLFRSHTAANEEDLSRLCVGIIGAAESLSNQMLENRLERGAAAHALTSIIVGSLSAGTAGSEQKPSAG